MKVECPRCHTHVEKLPGSDPVCPTCGFGSSGAASKAAAPGAPAASAAPSYATTPPAAAPSYGATPPGWAPPQSTDTWQTGGAAPKLNQTMAITSLVLGIVGCCLMLGPLTGIPAAIVGGLAMKKIKDEPTVYGGNGMALAGLILGILATIIGTIMIITFAASIMAVIDCEENPDTEFCRDLEDANQPPQSNAPPAWSGPATVAAPLLFIAPRRHAG